MKKYFVLYISALALFLLIVYNVYYSYQRQKHARYTAGKIFKLKATPNVGIMLYFKFQVGDKIVESDDNVYTMNIDTTVFYLIEYNSNSPSNAKIFIDKKLNIKSLSEIPDSGWSKIPEELLIK